MNRRTDPWLHRALQPAQPHNACSSPRITPFVFINLSPPQPNPGSPSVGAARRALKLPAGSADQTVVLDESQNSGAAALAVWPAAGVNPVNRKVALHILRQAGFDLDAVTSGREAIRVLDLRPLLATAANTMSNRERGPRVGMNDHISQPIRPEDLRGAVARWLGREVRMPA